MHKKISFYAAGRFVPVSEGLFLQQARHIF